ncbi:MAG TPA: hypothetical protein VK766_11585 [Cytophagaceae bacterium]|jgi:hypothetical protein|nr:hypothetical protein [Cytophagaceae bacterium]
MSTCGYICPQCGGKGFKENGSTCDWCLEIITQEKIALHEWIEKVHEGPCCSDLGNSDETN